MSGAVIQINQDRPGPSVSSGSPGVARKDLWVGQVVRPTSTLAGNSSQTWSLLDKPAGSSAALSSADQVTCSFTPDKPGSYRLRLVTNNGGAGNEQTLICACRYDSSGGLLFRGWRIPAFGEKSTEDNFSGNTRGWAADLETILSDVEAELTSTTTTHGSAPQEAAELDTTNATPTTIGSTFALASNAVTVVDVQVEVIKRDASITKIFSIRRSFLNTAGTVTDGAQQDLLTPEELGGALAATVSITRTGTTARVEVTGVAATNLRWRINRQVEQLVGSP